MNQEIKTLKQEAIQLLKELIATPSLSGEEDKTALLIGQYLSLIHISEPTRPY